jgi:hypothetical protein
MLLLTIIVESDFLYIFVLGLFRETRCVMLRRAPKAAPRFILCRSADKMRITIGDLLMSATETATFSKAAAYAE